MILYGILGYGAVFCMVLCDIVLGVFDGMFLHVAKPKNGIACML